MTPILKLRKSRLFFVLTSFFVVTFACLAIATAFTAVTYARSCDKLTGFPGLLQRVGLVTPGPCATQVGGKLCNGGSACTPTGGGSGTCKNTAALGQPATCTCVPNSVSKGLR